MNSTSLPHLDDSVSEVNPIPWYEFLETRTTLKAEYNGVRWYVAANSHYIVHHQHVHLLYGFWGQTCFHWLAYAKQTYNLSNWKHWHCQFYEAPPCLPLTDIDNPLVQTHLLMLKEKQRQEEQKDASFNECTAKTEEVGLFLRAGKDTIGKQ